MITIGRDLQVLAFYNDQQYREANPLVLKQIELGLQEFSSKNSLGFRGDAFFVPITYDWQCRGGKLVGTLVVHDPSRHPEELRPKHPSDDRYREVKMQFSQKAVKSLSNFANCLVCDLRKRKADQELRSLVSFSRLSLSRYGNIRRRRPL